MPQEPIGTVYLRIPKEGRGERSQIAPFTSQSSQSLPALLLGSLKDTSSITMSRLQEDWVPLRKNEHLFPGLAKTSCVRREFKWGQQLIHTVLPQKLTNVAISTWLVVASTATPLNQVQFRGTELSNPSLPFHHCITSIRSPAETTFSYATWGPLKSLLASF